jgi:hypothetical protein
MNTGNYSLDIISLDANTQGRRLKKYGIEDMDFIGVHENEPFEVQFKNNTMKRVQVRVSLDGTDVLTGKPASTEPTGQMWLVEGYGTLHLKAWPETNNGGARFVFTDTQSSVAANTHGITSSKGVIAVAVFEEGYIAPVYWTNNTQGSGWLKGNGIRDYTYDTNFDFDITLCSEKQTNSRIRCSDCSDTQSSTSLDFTKSAAAIGAGEYTQQAISYTKGLREPKLETILTVRYEWWTSLRSKLRTSYKAVETGGFPGDSKRLDLGKTPRVKSSAQKPKRRYRRKRDHVELERLA